LENLRSSATLLPRRARPGESVARSSADTQAVEFSTGCVGVAAGAGTKRRHRRADRFEAVTDRWADYTDDLRPAGRAYTAAIGDDEDFAGAGTVANVTAIARQSKGARLPRAAASAARQRGGFQLSAIVSLARQGETGGGPSIRARIFPSGPFEAAYSSATRSWRRRTSAPSEGDATITITNAPMRQKLRSHTSVLRLYVAASTTMAMAPCNWAPLWMGKLFKPLPLPGVAECPSLNASLQRFLNNSRQRTHHVWRTAVGEKIAVNIVDCQSKAPVRF